MSFTIKKYIKELSDANKKFHKEILPIIINEVKNEKGYNTNDNMSCLQQKYQENLSAFKSSRNKT